MGNIKGNRIITTSFLAGTIETITIKADNEDTEKAFGNNVVSVSKDTLQQLANSARIVTNEQFMPKALFLAIQNDLKDKIKSQEHRTLKDILGNDYKKWKENYKNLGLIASLILKKRLTFLYPFLRLMSAIHKKLIFL